MTNHAPIFLTEAPGPAAADALVRALRMRYRVSFVASLSRIYYHRPPSGNRASVSEIQAFCLGFLDGIALQKKESTHDQV